MVPIDGVPIPRSRAVSPLDGERGRWRERGDGAERGREGGREGERERCRERKREILPDWDVSSLKIEATNGTDMTLAPHSRFVRFTSS